jgi:ArsR family transcriptional regulator, arsenate/arsenite/antimonite-responsive transcriptional repressor
MDAGMNDLVSTLKALADETRFRIINLLLTHDLCVGALADHLGISKAAVSQHLQILRKTGLVKGEKRGYWTHYGVDKSAIHQIAEELMHKTDQAPDFRIACNRSVPDKINTDDIERRRLARSGDCCRQPDRLKGKPEKCTLEQIKACHGDDKEHPCVPKKEKK